MCCFATKSTIFDKNHSNYPNYQKIGKFGENLGSSAQMLPNREPFARPQKFFFGAFGASYFYAKLKNSPKILKICTKYAQICGNMRKVAKIQNMRKICGIMRDYAERIFSPLISDPQTTLSLGYSAGSKGPNTSTVTQEVPTDSFLILDLSLIIGKFEQNMPKFGAPSPKS